MKIIKIDCDDERYPKRLLEIKDFPKELYVMGNMDLLQSKYTVGIVGSRKCTEYGRKVSYGFAKEISKNGICVVSGMAIGIDAMAHEGAIEQIGNTIAVLGCGFNHIYPKENEWIFHKIIENCGCIVTEYEPDVESNYKNFPKRNRIISGLSDSILVVEAAYRSGSSITARYALEQGKTVYAIPSNIYNSAGLGTNIMIQEGAKLLIKPSEIIKYIKENLKNTKQDEKKNTNLKQAINSINESTKIQKEYLPIYKLLSNEPIHINDIAKKLETTIKEITPVITMMEIEGYTHQIQTNYFVRKE